MEEIWMDIKEYEGMYQISSFGRVKSLDRIDNTNRHIKERILKPGKNNGGYFNVVLSKKNNMKTFKVHRLVALAFLPNTYNYPQVNHKNDIRTDNRLENLYWGTQKENVYDAIRSGKFRLDQNCGEKFYGAKLNNEKIIMIKQMWNTNNFFQREIAGKFNISRSNVSEIVNNRSWKGII
ncbi:MAG: NUMOD4 domain-containing protein [Nanoarchaeota archaeon]